MPIYDARLNDPLPGGYRFGYGDALPFPAIPCRVTDATGAVLPLVRRCNTETGDVELYEVKPGTNVFVIGDDHRPVILLERHPAPLRVEPLYDIPMTSAEVADFRRWQAGQRAKPYTIADAAADGKLVEAGWPADDGTTTADVPVEAPAK